jgi:hypothetical protein
MASQCSVRHHAHVARNEYGTPLLDDLFYQADKLATSPYLCYVNSDIIFMSDFMEAFLRLASVKRRFLMVGQRVDVFVNEPLIFDATWVMRLRQLAYRTGELYAGIDYFVYPKGLWDYIPPLP